MRQVAFFKVCRWWMCHYVCNVESDKLYVGTSVKIMCCILLPFTWASAWLNSLTQKMETGHPSKQLIYFPARCRNPEDLPFELKWCYSLAVVNWTWVVNPGFIRYVSFSCKDKNWVCVQMVYVPECKFLLCCVGVLNYFHSQVQHSWIT